MKTGQPVFEDKKNPGVLYTAPGSGTVKEINRGEKRRFLSLVIDLDDSGESESFPSYPSVADVDPAELQATIIKAGLWSAFRTRPYSKVPVPGSEPSSIFVTAVDTNPLAAEPELIIESNRDSFVTGLAAISRFTSGKTYVCTRDDSRVPGSDVPGVTLERFVGPHPSGLVGTHIAKLDPVGPNRTVWHIGYQDVIAIGHLLSTGGIMTERVYSVAGPRVNKPALYKSRLGANIDQLVAGNVSEKNNRVISGSVFNGRTSAAPENFVGRYHQQVSVLEEGNQREFLGWQGPGFNKFSLTNIYAGSFTKKPLADDHQFGRQQTRDGSRRDL